MIKGAQKQMIVVRTAASRYFDEAYFVLRHGVGSDRSHEPDLLTEAQRILEESETHRAGKRVRRGAWVWFAIGMATGTLGAVVASVCLRFLLEN